VNSQLNRFYLHNGGAQDNGLLNEKWESLALVPVTPSNDGSDGNFFLFSMSDNDFITQVSEILPVACLDCANEYAERSSQWWQVQLQRC